jgi:predicted component of type VI protein secretion system
MEETRNSNNDVDSRSKSADLDRGCAVHFQQNSPSSHGRLNRLAGTAQHLAPLARSSHTLHPSSPVAAFLASQRPR